MKKSELLHEIAERVKVCQKCRLCEYAQNAVPGEGNINSEIVFIGEAPGATEDATGRPFVGRAGRVVEKLLSKINLDRSDVWIGNIVKHRPPENRDPLPDEIAACQPYLKAQLKIIAPKIVITLGRFAMNHFYPEGKISRDHGMLIKVDTMYVFPLYHPAAALRNSQHMLALENDFLKIPGLLRDLREGKEPSINSLENLIEKKKVEKPIDTNLGF